MCKIKIQLTGVLNKSFTIFVFPGTPQTLSTTTKTKVVSPPPIQRVYLFHVFHFIVNTSGN